MRLANTGRACHPAVRPNSLRHWVLDESVIGDATDVMGGLAATLFGTAPGPTVLDGPTGKARRFSDVNAILRAPLAAADQAVMLGDWTVACLLRISAAPGGTVTAFAYAGAVGDAPADPQNYLMSIQLTPARNLQMFWENGAGANVTSLASTYVLPVGPWTLVHWVKSATTGPGPVGTCSLTLYVNGYPVEKFTGVQNASDGGAAVWRIGGEENAGAPFQRWQRDIAGAYAWAGALTAAQVAEDMRRVRRLPFFTRADLRVEVQNSTGVGINLCDTAGVDFVDSVSITDEVDQPCTTARVDLFREVGNVSLAVLNTTTKLNLTNPLSPVSYAPLLLEGRGIEVFTARVPLGCTATGKDWESTFKGFIDEVEEGGEKTSLQCRDLGALLIDTYIEQTIPYGSDTIPAAVEGEMQFILNDNDNDPLNNSVPGLVARTGSYAPITLWTPSTPSWAVKRWSQRREAVLMALRNLAAQIGWECRYRFDPLTDTWRLKFYDPERDRLDADVLLGPDEFQEIGRFQRSILGIRNVVRVVYPSSETSLPAIPPLGVGYIARQGWNNLDGESRRMTAYVEVESTLSIAAFGRRLFMEFAEAGTTQIDTIGEAFDMAYGALRDLEESKLTFSGTVQFMPELELNDIVILDSNPVLHTAQQRLAVRSVTHSFGEQATSTVELRGRPSVGWKRWLRLETRTGNGRPGVTTPQDANADMQQGPLLQVMRNLLDRTQAFQGGKFLQIRNPNFQGFTNGRANVPDGWSMRAGVWNTDATADTTDQQSGNIALKLLTSTAQLESDFIPVSGDFNTPYSVETKWKRGVVSTYLPRVDVEFYDVNKVIIVGATVTLDASGAFAGLPDFQAPVPNNDTAWQLARSDGIRPPAAGTARWIKLVLRGSAVGVFTPLWFDDVAAYRTGRELNTFGYGMPGAVPTVGWTAIALFFNSYPTNPFYNGRWYDWGNNAFDTGLSNWVGNSTIYLTGELIGANFGQGFYARESGTYLVNGTFAVGSTSAAANQNSSFRLVKNATYAGAGAINAGGTVVVQTDAINLQPRAGFASGLIPVAYQRAGIATVSTRVQLSRGDRLTLEFYRGNLFQSMNLFSDELMVLDIKQEITQ